MRVYHSESGLNISFFQKPSSNMRMKWVSLLVINEPRGINLVVTAKTFLYNQILNTSEKVQTKSAEPVPSHCWLQTQPATSQDQHNVLAHQSNNRCSQMPLCFEVVAKHHYKTAHSNKSIMDRYKDQKKNHFQLMIEHNLKIEHTLLIKFLLWNKHYLRSPLLIGSLFNKCFPLT